MDIFQKLDKLQKLKEEKDAVILAHYYVDKDIQKIADYVGDSFYLAQMARKITVQTIVMAGVYFMGESVKILNPDKTVLMIDNNAGCPMVNMVSVEAIKEMRKKYADLAVVCYINSSAEIKSYCDVCVTSSNALKIVSSLSEKNIFFVPDANLGSYIASKVTDKNILLNRGCCPVHDKVSAAQVKQLMVQYPNAKVLAHPECKKEVLAIADYVGSTSGIIEVAGLDGKDFIIITEIGIAAQLRERYPDKTFYFLEDFVCQDMKLLTLDKLIDVLEFTKNEMEVDDLVAKNALSSLERMITLG